MQTFWMAKEGVPTLSAQVDRARYVVEGIGASVRDYETSDDETSQVFDALTSMLGRRRIRRTSRVTGCGFPA